MAAYLGMSCAARPHPPPAVHDLSLGSLGIPPLGSAQIIFSCPRIIFAPTEGRAAARVGELSRQPPAPGGRGFPGENTPPNPWLCCCRAGWEGRLEGLGMPRGKAAAEPGAATGAGAIARVRL